MNAGWWDIFLCLPYVIALGWLFYKAPFFKLAGISSKWLVLAFATKVLAGFALAILYSYYYTDRSVSDTWKYFDDAMQIRELWNSDRSMFWQIFLGEELDQKARTFLDTLSGWTNPYTYGLTHDYPTIIRIQIVISLFSFGHYSVHVLFFAAMSTIGATAIFKVFKSSFIQREGWLFIACFFLPSVLFWGSGVLKEAPMMMAFGLLWWSLFQLYRRGVFLYTSVVFIASSSLLIFLKEYVILSMVPSFLFLGMMKLTKGKFLWLNWGLTHILILSIALNAHVFYDAGDFLYILQKKRDDFYNTAELFNAGSVVFIPIASSVFDLLIYLPQAFLLTWFRPLPGEFGNVFMSISMLENTVYLLLVFLFPFHVKRSSDLFKEERWCAFSFILLFTIILGFTVPVLGAVVRYRIPGLLLGVVVLLSLMNTSKWDARLNKVFRFK